MVAEGEAGLGGIRRSAEANEIGGLDDRCVQDEVHDPLGSVNVSRQSEGTAHRLAEAGGQSNTIQLRSAIVRERERGGNGPTCGEE